MYNILALSSSRTGNDEYLQHALPLIKDLLGRDRIKVAFIPFASVSKPYSDYLKMVRDGLDSLGYQIILVDEQEPQKAISTCDAIMIGGGNTFKLLHNIYALNLFQLIQEKVAAGTPYIGWSAGSNITGLTISTTNDMPIIQPRSFNAFGFLPFQLNPHYINEKNEGFHGETRDQRLEEFVILNPGLPVIGLPEGTALILQRQKLLYAGPDPAFMFTTAKDGTVDKRKIENGEDLSFLLQGSFV
jgi:dipeptidase E